MKFLDRLVWLNEVQKVRKKSANHPFSHITDGFFLKCFQFCELKVYESNFFD